MFGGCSNLLQVCHQPPTVQVGGLLFQELAVADDRVERGPKLVGHVRQELGLVLAGQLRAADLSLRFPGRAERSGWPERTELRMSATARRPRVQTRPWHCRITVSP